MINPLHQNYKSNYSGTESFLKEATKIIYTNRLEFDDYIRTNQKLAAVKALRDYLKVYTDTPGLKDCKDIYELYVEGKLVNIREERKEKLERLAKIPLVDQLIIKFKNIEETELHSLLMKLSVDTLLNIDEFFPEEIE